MELHWPGYPRCLLTSSADWPIRARAASSAAASTRRRIVPTHVTSLSAQAPFWSCSQLACPLQVVPGPQPTYTEVCSSCSRLHLTAKSVYHSSPAGNSCEVHQAVCHSGELGSVSSCAHCAAALGILLLFCAVGLLPCSCCFSTPSADRSSGEFEPADEHSLLHSADQSSMHVPIIQARVGASSWLLHLPPRHCSAIAISPVVHSLFSSSTVCCTLLAVVSCRCSFSPHRAASAFGTPPLAYAAAFNAVASNQCGTHQPGRRE